MPELVGIHLLLFPGPPAYTDGRFSTLNFLRKHFHRHTQRHVTLTIRLIITSIQVMGSLDHDRTVLPNDVFSH
jgi:hypothetical protein